MLLRVMLCCLLFASKIIAIDEEDTKTEFIEKTALFNAITLIEILDINKHEDLLEMLEDYDLKIIENEPYPPKAILVQKTMSGALLGLGILAKMGGVFILYKVITLSSYIFPKDPNFITSIDSGLIVASLFGLFGIAIAFDFAFVQAFSQIKNLRVKNELWFNYYNNFRNKNSQIYQSVKQLTIQILKYILGFEENIDVLPVNIRDRIFKERQNYLTSLSE